MNLEVVYKGTLAIDPEGEDLGEFDAEDATEQVFDATMTELLKLGALDPCVSGAIRSGEIEILLTIESDSLTAAVTEADAMVRTALHAANVTTAGWPSPEPFRVEFHTVQVDDPAIAPTEPVCA
jgi:hypothetical protein